MTHYLGPADSERAHFVLVGEGGVGVLDRSVPAEALIGIWQLLADPEDAPTDPEGFARTVGEVLSVLDPQPSGVIVRFLGTVGGMQVLTHGAGRAHCFTADGDIEVGDDEAADPLSAIWRSPGWTSTTVDAVRGLSLDLGDVDPDGVVLPLGSGIARGEALQWGLPARQARHAADATGEQPAAAAESPHSPQEEPSPPADDWRVEETVLMAGASRPAPIPAADPIDEQAQEVDDTVLMAPRRRGAGVRLPDGALDAVRLTLVVGRRPQLPVYVVTPDEHRLLAVPSPTREVSGTHLEVSRDGETIVARDLGSTNGTIIVRPGHKTFLLRNGDSVALPLGATADLGDGNIIEVVDLAAQ